MTHEIDFLPSSYRAYRARRVSWAAWGVAAIAWCVGCGAVLSWEWAEWGQVEAELETVRREHDEASAKLKRLNEVEKQLESAEAEANLLTYLRHPWPRSRIVAALVEPLPRSAVLEEIRVTFQADKPSLAAQSGRTQLNREELEARQRLAPAVRDLETLRAIHDRQSAIAFLSGFSNDVGELHDYIAALHEHPLIVKAEIQNVEAGESAGGPARFELSVTFTAGHGQVNGPATSVRASAPVQREVADAA